MDKIKELEKQIKEIQKATEKKVKELQEEIDKLKNDNSIPRRRYYNYIDIDLDGNFYVNTYYNGITTKYYDNWNYFLSEVNASNFLNTLNELKKLQHYHDIYCPEYVPDWNNKNKEKWYIIFDESPKKYCYGYVLSFHKTTIYFDSKETVKKICDELNKNL